MSMLLRRRMMRKAAGGLPAAYRRVEYLQNSSDGYIATTYTPPLSENIRVSFDCSRPSMPSGTCAVFGYSTTASTDYALYVSYWHARGSWYAASGLLRSDAMSLGGTTLDTMYHAELTHNTLEIDDATGSFNSVNSTGSAQPIYIFARNRNGSANAITPNLRLHSLSFYDGDSLSADFIPCVRISDGEPGMYETVSRKFYTNAGGGEFIIPT